MKKLMLAILILLIAKNTSFSQCTSIPTISGNAAPCGSSTSNYSTELGMTNYTWSVIGGYFQSPGPPFINSVVVTWLNTEPQTISVIYTDASGCRPTLPTVKSINIVAAPVPTISGSTSVCLNSAGNIYSTESGQTSYVWAVTGGTITAGTGTNTITVTWSVEGSKEVSVRYTALTGCTSNIVSKIVAVNTLAPASISGNETVCQFTGINGYYSNYTYVTQTGKAAYNWSIIGGSIVSNNGNSVSVAWTSVGVKNISVSYIDPTGCIANPTATKNVTVTNLPVSTITGNSSACQFHQTNVYTTEPGMSSYSWTFSNMSSGPPSPAGHIISGAGTNSITVRWGGSGSNTVSVNYTNPNGCSAPQPTAFNVNVAPVPFPGILSGPTTVCEGVLAIYTAPSGQPTYNWTTIGNGIITSGAGTNSVTIRWNSGTSGHVYLNYGIQNGCQTLDSTLPITIRPAHKIQNFPPSFIPLRYYGAPPFQLFATSNSGLPVSYASSNLSVATISGNTVTIVGAGSTTITVSQAGNSTICPATSVSFVFEFSKAVLTATPANTSITYGASNPIFNITYTGFVNGDNASVIDSPPAVGSSATSISNVGSYPISISGGLDNNYEFNYGTPATLTVNKAPLTATSNAAKVYGSTNPTFPISYSGFMNGETAAVIDTSPTASSAATQSSNVGTYPINLTGGFDNNYTINLPSGTFSITKAPLTVTANNETKLTGQHNPPFSLFYNGFLNGDNSSVIDSAPTLSSTATTNSSPGTYPITPTGGYDNNYNFTYTNGTLTVNTAPICSVSITTTGDLCTQAQVLLKAITSGGKASYAWSTNETANNIYARWGGYYTVTANFINGCSATSTIYINDVSGPGCIYYLMVAPEPDPEPTIEKTTIFPNPVDDELTIELPEDFLKQYESVIPLSLIDPIGKMAYQSEFKKGLNRIKINTREMVGGVYIIQIGSSYSGVIRRKVMIVHKQ